MTFEEAVKKLMDSKEFKEWKKNEYLTHGFLGEEGWEIGFYNPTTDLITTFKVGSIVKKDSESQAFKESGIINELNLKDIEINLDEATMIAKGIIESVYHGPAIMKKIIIIQNINNVDLYNFTFLTAQFKTLNVKVDAKTGKIISHTMIDLLGRDK